MDYELTFIIGEISDEREDALMDSFDCIVGVNHAGEQFITMTQQGSSGVAAAKSAHMELVRSGITVERFDYDLVARAQIAERLDVTPQAVGLWIRGERRPVPFPRMFNQVGVWLWGDVVAWCRAALAADPADGLHFLDRTQIAEVNACIGRGYAVSTSQFEWIVEVSHDDVQHDVQRALVERSRWADLPAGPSFMIGEPRVHALR